MRVDNKTNNEKWNLDIMIDNASIKGMKSVEGNLDSASMHYGSKYSRILAQKQHVVKF